ncbi:MAG: hypothetical protein IJ595_00555 [Oscillospiraceae bacterium]|nr:hypothetical protein [Oscillospiraceae bacterium]
MFQHREVFVKISPEQIIRHDEKVHADVCDGFLIEIYEDDHCQVPLEIIGAAVGYELSENSEDEAAEFIREYLDEMADVYRRLLSE